RTSSQEKEQIWQTFLKKADKAITYGLYTAIIIAKKNDENIEKIHKRIEMMAAELKVQELEQKAQSQNSDQESEKKAVNLVPPTNNPSGENDHQPLTKTELKEPAPIAEKPPIKPSKKTPSERERD
ncbi:27813_t:CDS:2, partial [Gigaspora margarita]